MFDPEYNIYKKQISWIIEGLLIPTKLATDGSFCHFLILLANGPPLRTPQTVSTIIDKP